MHLIFLSLTLGLQGGNLIDTIDLEFAQGAGWACEGRGKRQAKYRRASDGAAIAIRAHESTAEDLESGWKEYTLLSRTPRYRFKIGPSGWLLGDAVQHTISPGSLTIKTRIGRVFMEIQAAYRGTGPRGNVEWQKDDPDGDIERVEGAARHAVARLAGAQLTSGSNVTVNGRTIGSVFRNESGASFVPLTAWASARNIELNRNDRAGKVAFVRNGKTYVMALGTDQAKVDTDWRSLGSFFVRRGATWYAPLQGVEAMIR